MARIKAQVIQFYCVSTSKGAGADEPYFAHSLNLFKPAPEGGLLVKSGNVVSEVKKGFKKKKTWRPDKDVQGGDSSITLDIGDAASFTYTLFVYEADDEKVYERLSKEFAGKPILGDKMDWSAPKGLLKDKLKGVLTDPTKIVGVIQDPSFLKDLLFATAKALFAFVRQDDYIGQYETSETVPRKADGTIDDSEISWNSERMVSISGFGAKYEVILKLTYLP